MDAAQWKLEANGTSSNQVQERKVRPLQQSLNCPRCKSTNTKFCYYNNYSLSQPRYFCKACRRYWTQGGSLRNVPVGGGSRKNKRSVTSSSSLPLPRPKPIDLSPFSSQTFTTPKPQDLNLGFQTTKPEYQQGFSRFLDPPKIENSNKNQLNLLSSSASSTLTCVSPQHLLTTRTISGGLNSFNTTTMLDSNAMFNRPGFNLQEFKPTMGFSFHENGIKRAGFQEYQEDGGRIMLPFGVLNQQLSSTRVSGQNMGQEDSAGYWNGTLGGGSC